MRKLKEDNAAKNEIDLQVFKLNSFKEEFKKKVSYKRDLFAFDIWRRITASNKYESTNGIICSFIH